jgi:hypothetical protein
MANGFDPVASILAGRQARKQINQMQGQDKLQQLRQALAGQAGEQGFNPAFNQNFQQFSALDPGGASQILSNFNNLSDARQGAFFQDAQRGLELVNAGRIDDAIQLAQNRGNELRRIGGDTTDTDFIANALTSGQIDVARNSLQQAVQGGIRGGFLKDPLEEQRRRQPQKSAEQRQFEDLTADLTADEKRQAKLIKLGLSPRAVGSAIQTISREGIADQIGSASAIIKNREKFAEKTGASRAKAIDDGFDRIKKIDLGIGNIDRAIQALEQGAGTGAIQKFLPSLKAASVELDNIQKSMALDVIGAVTFGALSEGELNLAKEVALPTGLRKDQLIQHLNDRKAAQNKLRAYYNEQIQHLDQGGTVASFLRAQERNQQQAPAVEQAQPPAPAQQLNLQSLTPQQLDADFSIEQLQAMERQILQQGGQ